MSGRYSRSELFPGIGPAGQQRIRGFSIAFVGVGAVGAAAAEMAARAGFGRMTLVDRDVVEESNLARQFLFDAEDAARIAPKAEAAAARLREIDPSLPVAAVVADLSHVNAREVLGGHDIVLDGSDNSRPACCLGRRARARDALGLRGVRGRGGARRGVRSREDAVPALLPRGVAAGGLGATRATRRGRADLAAARRVAGDDRGRADGGWRNPAPGMLTLTVWSGGFRSRRLFEMPDRPPPPRLRRQRYPALEGEGAAEMVKLCGGSRCRSRRRTALDPTSIRSSGASPLGRVRRSPSS